MKVAVDVVRYEDYGAKGDGKTDDVEAIAKAHAFANQHGLPVRADDKATYYIGGQDRTAVILTDTDFGLARFIIDDTAVQNIRANVFEVRSAFASIKPDGITSLNRNQRKLEVAFPGRCLVQVTNAGVKHFIRKGLNPNSGGSQTEVFLVDADGNVAADTPVQWDFAQVTDIVAYPVDEKILTIKGGRFTTIANAAESAYTYYARGISIKRSNVVVDGLEHRITGEGEHGAPYNGFINISNCADVTVRNTILTGHKTYQTIGKANKPVSMGSYGLSINCGVNITLENIRQTNEIHDNRYWGIMGTNFCRNLLLEGCTLSRFDAHQGVYNATIRNSTIGHMGILVIGRGTLLVENTTIRTRHFIGLRPDYGSTWQGEFILRNCVFAPANPDGAVLISGSNTGDHDFGYPCTMPERITIENLRVDDSKATANYKGLPIFANFNPAFKDSSYKQAFPYAVTREIILKNVTTASGKSLRVSDNTFMFKDVVVRVSHGMVGLRPLPRTAALDHSHNHGGSWAGTPTYDVQSGKYPFVAENLDLVKGWLDGDFKTKRMFFEYYWGIDQKLDDLDPEKNGLIKTIRDWESKGSEIEHILICREYDLAIHRGYKDAQPGPFKEDTRILYEKDVDDIRAMFKAAHKQGMLKHDNYKLIQMVQEPSFFADDKRVHPIIAKMEGVCLEVHQFNRHWPLETGWVKPDPVVQGAKWTLDQGKEYVFYYGPIIWKCEQYYPFIERDWLKTYWTAGLPKHHPKMHYYLNTFPHETGRGRPVGPETDPHSILGFTKWLIEEIKMSGTNE